MRFLEEKTLKRSGNNISKAACLLVAAAITFTSVLSGCEKKHDKIGETTPTPTEPAVEEIIPDTYTFNTYVPSLSQSWNPHTYEHDLDLNIWSYLSMPFCRTVIKSLKDNTYQYSYEMAESVTDVTKDHNDDIKKFKCDLKNGGEDEETAVESGYVFEIKLNKKAVWQDGTPINADSYIYSMKQMISPEMQNYRANLYYSGDTAVAGGSAYYNSGRTVNYENDLREKPYEIKELVVKEDGKYYTPDDGEVFIAVNAPLSKWLSGQTLNAFVNYWYYGSDMFDEEAYAELAAQADDAGFVRLTNDSLKLLEKVITHSKNWTDTKENANHYLYYTYTYPTVSFDEVGLYKVDDYTIRYVTESKVELPNFLSMLSFNWLVNEKVYEQGKTTDALGNVKTSYCTNVSNTISYGPYRLDSIKDGKMTFLRNENWYGWDKNEDGELSSVTPYLIDGEAVQRYSATGIVVATLDEENAKKGFINGTVDEWNPSSHDMEGVPDNAVVYASSMPYVDSFFFNTNKEDLKELDEGENNKNAVVLSNENFRKAFSLSLDREKISSTMLELSPCFTLLNDQYFYDIYNDPSSIYTETEFEKKSICEMYGISYGEGKEFATFNEAYDSITGRDLEDAKNLMKTALKELVSDKLYKEGEEIVIAVDYKSSEIEKSDEVLFEAINACINEAAVDSGFGKITLKPVGNIQDRFTAVSEGLYAIGFGAWGGASFQPFKMFSVFFDDDQYTPNEAGCWTPALETLAIKLNDKTVKKTWKNWAKSLVGDGEYANADMDTRLQIATTLEREFLERYYRIPVASVSTYSLLSAKVSYFTDVYNIMYGFGGIELLKFNYTDKSWAEYNKGK